VALHNLGSAITGAIVYDNPLRRQNVLRSHARDRAGDIDRFLQQHRRRELDKPDELEWPGADVAILALMVVFLLVSLALVKLCRSLRRKVPARAIVTQHVVASPPFF